MLMGLSRKQLKQIGLLFDMANQITLRTNEKYFLMDEYKDAKEKLDRDGLQILKYLQKRTVDRKYNPKRKSKQHEETINKNKDIEPDSDDDTSSSDDMLEETINDKEGIVSDSDEKFDERIEVNRDVTSDSDKNQEETIDDNKDVTSDSDDKLEETVNEKKDLASYSDKLDEPTNVIQTIALYGDELIEAFGSGDYKKCDEITEKIEAVGNTKLEENKRNEKRRLKHAEKRKRKKERQRLLMQPNPVNYDLLGLD